MWAIFGIDFAFFRIDSFQFYISGPTGKYNHRPNENADCAENSEDNYGIELGDSALKSTVSCSEP